MNPPSDSSPALAEPIDRTAAWLLVLGLFATVAIGAPNQFVLPDTLKSAAAVLAVLAAAFLFAWRLGTVQREFRWDPLLLLPFGLALLALVSSAWSPATSATMEAARWLMIGVAATLTVNVLRPGQFGSLAAAVHWGAAWVAVLALLEFWFGLNVFPAMAAPGANFGNRNALAEFIAASLPLSIWLLVQQAPLQRVALRAAAFGLILLALMCTGARAGLIAVGVGLVASGFFLLAYRSRGGALVRGKSALAAAAIPLAIVLALAWVPTSNQQIFEEHAEGGRGLTPVARALTRLDTLGRSETYVSGSSFGLRVAAWSAGSKMIAAHPVFGVGAGAWNTVSPLYLPDTLETEQVWYAHNEPLQLIAEYGLLAWVALGALLWLSVAHLAVAAGELRRREAQDLAFQRWTVVLGLALWGIVSLSGLPLHQPTTVYLLALYFGLLLAMRAPRTVRIAEAGGGALLAGRVVTGALCAIALVLVVQGMRSDRYVREAGLALNGLLQSPGLTPEQAAPYRAQALTDLRKGLDIYPDHGLYTVSVTDTLAQIGDPASVVWLSNMMLVTRPHVAALKCNLARAYADLGNFQSAGALVDTLAASRPRAPCLPLTRFVYEYKRGNFPGAVDIGQKMIRGLNAESDRGVARYVVDMSYRSAIRVPDHDAAVAILQRRGELWPELTAGSQVMIGQLLAQRAGTLVAPQALEAFRKAVTAASDQEKPGIMARIPEAYRGRLN